MLSFVVSVVSGRLAKPCSFCNTHLCSTSVLVNVDADWDSAADAALPRLAGSSFSAMLKLIQNFVFSKGLSSETVTA